MGSQLVDEVANQQAKQTVSFSPETERLLVKFLKMQMAKYYVGIVVRLFILGALIFSIIFTVSTVVPFVQDNLSMISNLQKTIDSLSTGKFSGLQNFNVQGVSDSVEQNIEEEEEATEDADLKEEIMESLKDRLNEVEE